MSNLAVDAYVKGYEAGWQIGLESAKKHIMAKAKAAAVENEIGEYVYLRDLEEYIKDDYDSEN